MDRSVTIEAPAKLNLRLEVGPRRADGYHPVRSLMVALEGVSDTVEISRASRRDVLCPGHDGRANLAWSALDALERVVDRALPVRVRIDKRIPAQAGLGGGSSDAAATLVGANRLLGLGLSEDELERIGAEVGSDVPFFVRGGAQWAEGRGERLTPAWAPAGAALVVAPAWGLATAEVYRTFDRLPPPPAHGDAPPPTDALGLAGWVRNDLWPPALALRPQLGALARGMRAAGAVATLLCGSGSAIAGLYPDTTLARSGRAIRESLCRKTRDRPETVMVGIWGHDLEPGARRPRLARS